MRSWISTDSARKTLIDTPTQMIASAGLRPQNLDVRSGPWFESWLLEHLRAKHDSGITPAVSVAKGRFTNLASEYRLLWESRGTDYQTYSDQLDVLKRQVLSEVASIWKGRSDAASGWYETACAPAIETELNSLMKERIRQARNVELSGLLCAPGTKPATTGNRILDEPEAAETGVPSVIPPDAAALATNGSNVPDQTDAARLPEQNVQRQSPPVKDAHVDLLEAILKKGPTTWEKWAKEHKLGRTTAFDWKALRSEGKPLTGKVSPEKSTEIEEGHQ